MSGVPQGKWAKGAAPIFAQADPAQKQPAPPLPPPPQQEHNPQLVDFFLVMDFEATCDETVRIPKQEIIEFPAVLVDARTTTIVAEFQRYVKPIYNPTLTEFCTNLTGIRQSQVDAAAPFNEVYAEFLKWLEAGNLGLAAPARSFAVVTCGDWDLKTMLPLQASYTPGLLQQLPLFFSRWVNIKKAMERLVAPNQRMRGMPDMLNFFKLPLRGRHHSGIWDCRNIASVLIKMLRTAVQIPFTTGGHGFVPWSGFPSPVPPTTIVSDGSEGGSGLGVQPLAAAAAAAQPPGTSTTTSAIPQTTAATVTASGALRILEGRNAVEEILARGAPKRMDKNEQIAHSKRLSFALRHGADELGLKMTSNGFVALAAILSHIKFRGLDEATVALIVRDNDKQRFTIAVGEDGMYYIRANQGHSMANVEVDLQKLTKATDIPCAVHGTYYEAWRFIEKEGLNRMKRQHIHFAKGLPGDKEVISGMRKNCEVLVYVDVEQMLRDGIEIFTSKNGVVLTAGIDGVVPPKYFVQVVDARTSTVLMDRKKKSTPES